MRPDFVPFNKIPRLFRDCVITEKLDGTNASVFITDDGELFAASRTRWITPDNDNFGFAKWCEQNKEELLKLGPGHHFGEWWGVGIQRGYDLSERRFSLFNTERWKHDDIRPKCCYVVPVLYSGLYSDVFVLKAISFLKEYGSLAQPNYMRPEGIIVWHDAAKQMFKVTCEDDEKPKGQK